MLAIRSLEDLDINTLAEAFNQAFSEYYFPIKYTPEALAAKLAKEGGDLKLSVGVFDAGKLVAFILHFYAEQAGAKVVYNGGTGVLLSHRGQGLTRLMYERQLPLLKSLGINRLVHEVLVMNEPAIYVYTQVGFHQTRTLNCYQGKLATKHLSSDLEVKPLPAFDWTQLQSFWDYPPTWQNAAPVCDCIQAVSFSFGAFHQGKLVGYLIYHPINRRLHQLAVDRRFRGQKVGVLLLNHLQQNYPDTQISVINVDHRLVMMHALFEKSGLTLSTQQYELAMDL